MPERREMDACAPEGCILVVGGSPEPSSPTLVRALAARARHVVAVDRGLDVLLDAGLAPDLFCGDVDSASERSAAAVRAAECAASGAASPRSGSPACPDAPMGFEVVRYDPHKDATDLELALSVIESRWGSMPVALTCLSGGKPDHFLGVMGRLASLAEAGARGIHLVEDGFTGRVLGAEESWRVAAPVGTRFSLIPLAPGTVVSESGMRWDLDRASVPLLSDLGISNVVERADALVTCHGGVAACWSFSAPAL